MKFKNAHVIAFRADLTPAVPSTFGVHTDWSLFIPVICMQKGTRYDGVNVLLNGQSVSKTTALPRAAFVAGYPPSLSVVDFTKEEETMARCETSGSGFPQANI